MPRYFFNVTNELGTELDGLGLALPNDDTASSSALEAMRAIQADDPAADWSGWTLHVIDEAGNTVTQIAASSYADFLVH